MKKILILTSITLLILFTGTLVYSFIKIHKQVDTITTIAINEFDKDAIGSLIDFINSENHSFAEKNTAIWALGQHADQKALPLLEKLNSETESKDYYDRKNGFSKYEIEKAIKWCKNGNLTSWMHQKIMPN